MLTTVLFDLDGTLARLELDFFLARYIRSLAPHFQEYVSPDLFAAHLMAGTKAMIANRDPGKTAIDVFWASFARLMGRERAVLEPIFTKFYAVDFPRLRPDNVRHPAARRLVRAVTERGYRTVIATNPVFPRDPIVQRLNWADCADFPYAYVTHGDEMHYCKPNPDFYHELIERLDLDPRTCLMVGNDVEEDMIAGRCGMATALVTDCLIDRGKAGITPDWRGTLAELADVFEEKREGCIFGSGAALRLP